MTLMASKRRPIAEEAEANARAEISLLEKALREKVEKLYDLVIRHDNTVYFGMTEMLWDLFFVWGALCGRRRAAEEFHKLVFARKRRRR